MQSLFVFLLSLPQTTVAKFITQLWAKLDQQFFEIAKGGSGAQKISGVLCRNRPGKKA